MLVILALLQETAHQKVKPNGLGVYCKLQFKADGCVIYTDLQADVTRIAFLNV